MVHTRVDSYPFVLKLLSQAHVIHVIHLPPISTYFNIFQHVNIFQYLSVSFNI